MSTIPASQLVAVNPGVLSAGGDAFALNGLVLTESARVPIGTVQSFASGAAVASFFGAGSHEAQIAGGGTGLGSGYFGGYDNSTQKPGALLFAQYPATAVAAYLRGGNVSNLTLAQLQALSGSLTVVIDGYTHVISSISLSSYNSFSAAAAGIQAAFTDPTEATFTASLGATFTGTGSGTNLTTTSVTGLISVGDTVSGSGVPANTTIVSQTSGTTGGAGVYVTSNATTSSSASLATASTVLDVTVDTDHAIAVGQTVVGSGVTGSPVITAQLGGTTGGVGTYRISGAQQSVASESMTGVATAPLVTFDSVSGAFVITSGITGTPSTAAFATGTLAAPLLLTSATGAVLSQGAAATTPSAFMNSLIQVTQNWATFMTAFDPDGGSGNSQKLAFAAWTSAQNDRYAYVCWDTDASPTTQVPATSCLGYLIEQASYSGTILIYEPSDLNVASFLLGAIASIDFEEPNGRTTMAFRSQAGLLAGVTNAQVAINLAGNPQTPGDFGNSYNFYGAYATANQGFVFFSRGTISGPFEWIDSYVNQIWLNNAFQLALMELVTQSGSIPYNDDGYALIEAALADPINAGLAFGAFRAGVTLSAAQIAEVNAAAGANIAGTLSTRGWYLQILDAAPIVRQGRASPQIKFWYVDGESIQAITLSSTALQ